MDGRGCDSLGTKKATTIGGTTEAFLLESAETLEHVVEGDLCARRLIARREDTDAKLAVNVPATAIVRLGTKFSSKSSYHF